MSAVPVVNPVAIPVVPAVPAMLAAPAGALDSVLNPWAGSNPLAPVESAVSWVALAAARRQNEQTASTPRAATVTTAATTNQAPVIAKTVLSAPNATTGVVTGTVTATDPENDKLTYKATTSTKGAVTITSAGVFTYIPTATSRHAAGNAGATTASTTDTVTVTVTDAKGATTTSAVTVPISPKNTAPTGKATVGVPNTSTGVVTGTVAGADADKDTLTYTATTNPAKGTLTVNATTGAFSYTPTAAARHIASATTATTADKADSFKVTITDGYGGSVTVPVTVAVSPQNTAPTNAKATVGTPNASTGVVTGSVTATDADADTFTYTASKPANGAVVLKTDGSFTYTPTAAARASAHTSMTAQTDPFTITISDRHGGTATVTVTPTIPASNSAPVAGKPSLATDPATGVVTGKINATDPDKDTLTYSVTSATKKGSIVVDSGTGAFTYTPTNEARVYAAKTGATTSDKVDSFTVVAKDAYGGAIELKVDLQIAPRAVDRFLASVSFSEYGASATNVAVTPNASLIFVGFSNGKVGVATCGSLMKIGTVDFWPLVTNAMTTGLAATNDFAYVGLDSANGLDGVGVIDVATSQFKAFIPFATPGEMAATPDGKRVYIVGGNGLSVINTSNNTVTNIGLKTEGIRDIALTADGKLAYLSTKNNSVAVLDTTTNKVIKTISVGPGLLPEAPNLVVGGAIATTPDGSRVYVTDTSYSVTAGPFNTVAAVDTKTGLVIAKITVGDTPTAIQVSPDGTRVYVANLVSGSVSFIDTATNSVVLTVSVGGSGGVAVRPDSRVIYVPKGNAISMINTW